MQLQCTPALTKSRPPARTTISSTPAEKGFFYEGFEGVAFLHLFIFFHHLHFHHRNRFPSEELQIVLT